VVRALYFFGAVRRHASAQLTVRERAHASLGGAAMARVSDASHRGALLFGGIAFSPTTTAIGPMLNET
jgi:hypothetical protein